MPDTAVRPSRNAQVDTRGVGDKGLVKLRALASVPVMMSHHQVQGLNSTLAYSTGSGLYSNISGPLAPPASVYCLHLLLLYLIPGRLNKPALAVE